MSEKNKPHIGGISQQRSRYSTIGGGESQTSERSSAQTSEQPDAQVLERVGTETSKRLNTQKQRERHTIYLPPELSEWLRVRAARTRKEMSELATEALERYRSEIESTNV